MYLMDTNIVSATSPIARAEVGPMVFSAWLRRDSERLFLSAVTIAEIEAGITRADRIGATTKAARLHRWLASVEHLYAGRILAFGIEEARHAGAIIDRARAHDPGFEDIAIAATAAAHGFTVLTANERHFTPLGVPFLNPLKGLPPS
ncbi:PIN domain-containing protein [Mesorhizobium sp. M1396]|uniref:PIN domain-containing protein n=1 Tax=Mesorhizobium sp. M1396 TaxID=2957095 RepID=UPI003339F922